MRFFALSALAVLAGACATTSADTSSDPGVSDNEVTAEADVFADRSLLTLGLDGPFDDLFAAAHAGVPNGPLPGLPRRVFDEMPGKLTFTMTSGERGSLDVTIKVRGNSSVSECPFPKLTVKLTDAAKAVAAKTPFARNTKFKIGTHCADAGDGQTGTVGRLRNEKSPLREQLILSELEALGLPATLASRPARITYTDVKSHATTERNAMLFEDQKALALRSGAPKKVCRTVGAEEECDPVLTDEELAALDPRNGLAHDRIAAFVLFHAAVGNWDWRLDLAPEATPGHGSRVWNHDVVMLGDGTALTPVAHDFDLASAVTGRIGPADITAPALTAQLTRMLAETTGLSDTEVDGARALFRAKKDALYAAVERSPTDLAGKALAKQHLDAFFVAIGN